MLSKKDKEPLEKLLMALSKLDLSQSIGLKITLMCMRANRETLPQVTEMAETSETEEELLTRIREAGMVLPDFQKEEQE